jgi:hypothetical protein
MCATLAALSTLYGLPAAPLRQSARGSTPASAGRPDESIIVSIPATAPWTDTGIVLKAGDRFDVRVWGRVTYGEGGEAQTMTPAGTGRGGDCSFAVVSSAVPSNAVVGNIATAVTFDGNGFLIGASRTVTVPVAGSSAPEGRLLLGINRRGVMCDRSGYDSWEFRNNGSGAFTAEIAIRRRK